MDEKLFIIDTNSPFFIQHPKKLINWSKAPYHQLEKKGRLKKKTYNRIKFFFEKYIRKIHSIGYNAISMDDMAHIIKFEFYDNSLRRKIDKYIKRFRLLFQTAKKYDLKVFLTTDIMFFNEAIEKYTKNKFDKILGLLTDEIGKLFENFCEIDGIIFRFGESDGVDVKGDFNSRLTIKTPSDANKFIRRLLPVFEKHNKFFIFRTWTTGGYRIGDLMWNPGTYRRTFRNIHSNNFIISLKYGTGDFFRYFKLNRLFFIDKINKIIELQTRREYEGFGEYPSFIGWDYGKYRNKIINLDNFSGILVWCQTGGWSNFRNFTFLKNTSLWNELNTFVTLKIFREGITVKQAIGEFYDKGDANRFIKFLKLSEYVIKNLLYDPCYAKQELYFNRLRLPTLVYIFWDNVTLSDAIITLYNLFNRKKKESLRRGYKAFVKLKKMERLRKELGLKYDYKFHYDTFRLVELTRRIIYKKNKFKDLKKLESLIKAYKKEYPSHYKFHIHITGKNNSLLLRLFLKVLIRRKSKYRIIDRILFNPFTRWLFLLGYRLLKNNFPRFIGNQAMPFEIFIK